MHQSELARDALAVERERSERLLLNVLPEAIADQLKEHEDEILSASDVSWTRRASRRSRR